MTDAGMKSYMISAGNSTDGPIGFVARIAAHSPEDALAVARKLLPEAMELRREVDYEYAALVEYFNVYVSPENLTVEEDIIDGETDEVDGDPARLRSVRQRLEEEHPDD